MHVARTDMGCDAVGNDLARRLLHQSDALGEFSYFFYDARGQRTHLLNPRGYSTYYRFDLLGRNTHREHALGGVAYMGYDEVGNQVLSEGPEESNFLGVYYQATSLLKRVEQDGTDDATVVSGEIMGSVAADLNAPGGKLYWVSGDLIRRGNLDGSGKETVYDFSATGTPQALRVDPNGQRVYFSAQATGVIRSVKTDGTDLQTVVTPGSLVNFLDLHPAAGHVYYTRYSSGDVRRVDFGGTNDQAIVSGLTTPSAIALDLVNRKVYWTESTPKTIKRANLDGSGTETVLTVSFAVAGLAVDPIRGFLFWVENNALKRANLDGTGTTTLVASGAIGDVVLSVPVRVSLTSYDGLRRATHVRDALMNVSYMGYDSRSSMTLRVDADGRATYMAYDAAKRVERQWHRTGVAGETDTAPSYYVYNQASEVTIVDDRVGGLGVSYFDYDRVGRVTKKTTRAGAVYHGYDASGLRTWLMDPRLAQSYYVYDAVGRNTAIESAAGRTAYFHYDKAGLETRKRGPANENLAYLSYDVAGRVSELVNRSSAGTVVTYFLYQRNQSGAPTRVTHEDGTFTYYQYDALDRLTQEHRVTNPTVYGFQYEYDQASRRTSRYDLVTDSQVIYSLDTRGLLREENEPDVDITTYEWDAAQRLVTRTGLTTATSYAHDQRNQVKDFTLEGFGSGTNHQFHYDGLGERVVMVGGVGGTTSIYMAYDGGRLVTERDQGGTTYQALRWDRKSEVVDTVEGGSSKAPVSDALGSVGRLPGVAGGRIYDAFGVEWSSSLASNTRAAFLPGAFLRLNSVPYQIGLTRGGLYLASPSLQSVPSAAGVALLRTVLEEQVALRLAQRWFGLWTWTLLADLNPPMIPPGVGPQVGRIPPPDAGGGAASGGLTREIPGNPGCRVKDVRVERVDPLKGGSLQEELRTPSLLQTMFRTTITGERLSRCIVHQRFIATWSQPTYVAWVKPVPEGALPKVPVGKKIRAVGAWLPDTEDVIDLAKVAGSDSEKQLFDYHGIPFNNPAPFYADLHVQIWNEIIQKTVTAGWGMLADSYAYAYIATNRDPSVSRNPAYRIELLRAAVYPIPETSERGVTYRARVLDPAGVPWTGQ